MVDADDRVYRRPRPHAWELTRVSGTLSASRTSAWACVTVCGCQPDWV